MESDLVSRLEEFGARLLFRLKLRIARYWVRIDACGYHLSRRFIAFNAAS